MHWVLTGGSVVLSSLQLLVQWLLKHHRRAGWMITMVGNVIAVPYEVYTSQYGFLVVCVLGWVNALSGWRSWSRYNVENDPGLRTGHPRPPCHAKETPPTGTSPTTGACTPAPTATATTTNSAAPNGN